MINLAIPKYVKIDRSINKKRFHFKEAFVGFDRTGALKMVFGKSLNKVLSSLEVRLNTTFPWGYMWIDEKKGMLVVSKKYLRKGNILYIYLDIVHELVHIKQLSKGMELFDKKYDYVDRPTEIEAYKVSANECKRLGMKRKEIEKYLEIPGWLTGRKLNRLCKNIDL